MGHVTYMATGNVDTQLSWKNLRERGHLEDLGVDRREY
jgi:hypothetical protein